MTSNTSDNKEKRNSVTETVFETFTNQEETTLYEILAVSETAPQGIINSSYKKLLQMYDPDLCLIDSKEIVETRKNIKFAYSVLSDPQKRKSYDLFLNNQRKKSEKEHEKKLYNIVELSIKQKHENKEKNKKNKYLWILTLVTILVFSVALTAFISYSLSESLHKYSDSDYDNLCNKYNNLKHDYDNLKSFNEILKLKYDNLIDSNNAKTSDDLFYEYIIDQDNKNSFNVGTSITDVRSIMGRSPDNTIVRGSGPVDIYWYYGTSYIKFTEEKVVSWYIGDTTLPIG